MTEHGDVTVVVTNYNYARFLPEAVASALAQDGGAPRVTVVDDGSTEADTEPVLAGLPAEVTVIRQANTGLSGARNTGLRAAQTPFLIVLDADDRLVPGSLRALKRPLVADPQLGFAYGVTRFFGDWDTVMPMPQYDPYKLLYRHMIGSTALMRRAVFDATGGFDPAFRGYEDWEFWLHALHHGWRGTRVDEVTFLYRRHGATMMAGARRDYRRWYRALRAKHAAVYARAAALAEETGAGVATRVAYRCFWGPRPLPAGFETWLQARLFGALSRRR